MGKRPAFEMADVIRNFGPASAGAGRLHAFQKKTLTDLLQCRTHALGGHLDACDGCGHVRASYNSCRNRNCPKCQSVEREAWIIARGQELLPAAYFHLVFTIPEQLNGLALHNPRFIYNALFEAAWQTYPPGDWHTTDAGGTPKRTPANGSYFPSRPCRRCSGLFFCPVCLHRSKGGCSWCRPAWRKP